MLRNKKCTACEDKNTKPLSREEVSKFQEEVSKWNVSPENTFISREFLFDNFVQSVAFINKVAEIAEGEGHHPDIHCFYNRVRLELSTHSISGLSENDFIVASKIDTVSI